MIALIIGILLILFSFLLIALGIIIEEDKPFLTGLTISIIIVIILSISLNSGKSIYKKNNTKLLLEKEQIEYLLENNISLYVIEQAQDYNKKNRLW